MANVIFAKGTVEAFKKVLKKDENTLYFLDNGSLYKGSVCYNNSVIILEDESDFPDDPVEGRIYLKKSTDEAKFWTGKEWVQINHIIDKTLSDEKSTNNAVSGDAIKEYIANKLKNLASEGVKAEVKVSKEEGNKLVEKSDGLYASGLNLGETPEDEIISSDGKGSVKSSTLKAGKETLNKNPDVKTLATELAVKNAITQEITVEKELIKVDVDKKLEAHTQTVDKKVEETLSSKLKGLEWTELS